MCSEIRRISCSDLLLSMSSGSNTTPDSPVEEEADKEETFELQETAPSETAEKHTHGHDPESEKLRKGKEGIIVGDDELEDHATASKIAAVSEDDEGFKTPTSPDHKIPAITQCPPAPIKPRPITLKRKASSPPPPGARRRLQFCDSPTEVESIFRPLSDQKDNVEEQQECKRSKNTDDED